MKVNVLRNYVDCKYGPNVTGQDVLDLVSVIRTEHYYTRTPDGFGELTDIREYHEAVIGFQAEAMGVSKASLIREERDYRATLNKKFIHDITANFIAGFIDHARGGSFKPIGVRKSDWDAILPKIVGHLGLTDEQSNWEGVQKRITDRLEQIRPKLKPKDWQPVILHAREIYGLIKHHISS